MNLSLSRYPFYLEELMLFQTLHDSWSDNDPVTSASNNLYSPLSHIWLISINCDWQPMRDQVQDQRCCTRVVIKRRREISSRWVTPEPRTSTHSWFLRSTWRFTSGGLPVESLPLPFENIYLLTIEAFQIKTAPIGRSSIIYAKYSVIFPVLTLDMKYVRNQIVNKDSVSLAN